MKYCSNSHHCPWGSAIDPGMCAYSANIEEDDDCPMIWQDLDFNMEKLARSSLKNNSSRPDARP